MAQIGSVSNPPRHSLKSTEFVSYCIGCAMTLVDAGGRAALCLQEPAACGQAFIPENHMLFIFGGVGLIYAVRQAAKGLTGLGKGNPHVPPAT